MREKLDMSHKNEVVSICSSIQVNLPSSIYEKGRGFNNYFLEYDNPLRRGQLIEDLLIQKIALANSTTLIRKVKGAHLPIGSKYGTPAPKSANDIKEYLSYLSLRRSVIGERDTPNIEDHKVLIMPEIDIMAKKRCLPKMSFGYAFIDLILDERIIDIKTDINFKGIRNHFRQVFLHSIMFNTFIKRKLERNVREKGMKIICDPINTVGMYYWRFNELIEFSLNKVIEQDKYDKLVDIYSRYHFKEATELRSIIQKSIIIK